MVGCGIGRPHCEIKPHSGLTGWATEAGSRSGIPQVARFSHSHKQQEINRWKRRWTKAADRTANMFPADTSTTTSPFEVVIVGVWLWAASSAMRGNISGAVVCRCRFNLLLSLICTWTKLGSGFFCLGEATQRRN